MGRLVTSRDLPGSGRELMTRLTADPADWLPDPARRRGIDRWTVDLVAGPLTRSVACRVGSVWRAGDAVWRSIVWEPQPERGDAVALDKLLPVFHGRLRLKAIGDHAKLILDGSYAPPASFIGAVADALALHHVAQTTAEHFVTDVVRSLFPVMLNRG